MKYQLGKIEKIDLRSVWKHEAHDFTKWLAQPENLAELGNAIDMELELIEAESNVGGFHVDIFAIESGTSNKVVIENQLEETNHDHLGKTITYAAGKDAKAIVWIVARARDEHRQAIEWLNLHTDSEIGFFLVQIELWSINGSIAAPRFNVIESPNEWIKESKVEPSLTETQKLQMEYWRTYRETALADQSFSKAFKPHKPLPQNWTNLSLGSSKYHASLSISTMHSRISVELYVRNDKELGQMFFDNQTLFEEKLGCPAVQFDAKKDCGLRFFKENCSLNEPNKWSEYIEWQLQAVLKLREVVKELGF